MKKKLVAFSAAAMAAMLFAVPATRAGIVDLLTFQAAVDAAQAVDPTLDPPPNDGKHDFVVGGFQNALLERVGLSAHSDPHGANVYGHESITFPRGTKIRGKVVCLAVSGKFAAWGIMRTSPQGGPASGDVEVGRDGGPGGKGDGWSLAEEGTDPTKCAQYLPGAFVAPPLESGNILIHDEP
jgi:hypothetical protein